MKYLVTRRRHDDKRERNREFYVGNLEEGGSAWSDDRDKAKPLSGETASVLCENLTTRGGYEFVFTFIGA